MFLFALGIFCFVSGRLMLAVVCFSLLPLLRPEGFYFMAPPAITCC